MWSTNAKGNLFGKAKVSSKDTTYHSSFVLVQYKAGIGAYTACLRQNRTTKITEPLKKQYNSVSTYDSDIHTNNKTARRTY